MLVKLNIGVALLTLGLAGSCWGQELEKKSIPSACTKTVRVHGAFPKQPYKTLPGESYKRGPAVKYVIGEDGKVSNARITKSSGIADLDKKVLDSVERWRYKPRPVGCGVIETEMAVVIDWSASD